MNRLRASASVFAVVTLSLLVPGMPTIALPATPGPLGLPDGEWSGWISIGGAFTVEDGTITLSAVNGGNGTLDVSVVGGTPGGWFEIGYTSSGTVSGDVSGTTTGTATLTGTVGGSSVSPILVTESIEGVAAGEMNIDGQSIPIPEMPVSISADQIPQIDLQYLAVSCDSAIGILGLEFEQSQMATGSFSTFGFTGSWMITKAGSTHPDDSIAIELLARGEAMVTALQRGESIDVARIDAVLFDSERFLEASTASPDCGGSGASWASPVAGSIQRLVDALLARPDLDVSTLRIAIETAARAGLLSDPASALSVRARDVASAALERALGAGDRVDLILIEAIARAAGWNDLQARAASASDSLPAGYRDRGSASPPADEPLLARAGIATIEVSAPAGAATRPTFAWSAVEGAATYALAVRTPSGGLLWAWNGAATTIALGTVTADAGTGPALAGGESITVYAFDVDGALIGASPWAPL